MNPLTNNSKLLIAAFVFIGVSFWFVSYALDKQEQQLTTTLREAVTAQHKSLTELADLTDQNGADPVVKEVIVDCKLKDRVRFDEMLGELTTLTPAELTEIQGLFDKCANYFAKRKQLMVARLDREYGVYTTMVNLLADFEEPAVIEHYGVSQWEKLVALEKRRGEIFAERVRIQQEIINDLRAGQLPNSKVILDRVTQANEMTEELVVIDKQSDELRSRLREL